MGDNFHLILMILGLWSSRCLLNNVHFLDMAAISFSRSFMGNILSQMIFNLCHGLGDVI